MGSHFDPVFIIYQIIAIQCFFYLAMGTIWGVCHAIFDSPVSLQHFFTAKFVHFNSVSGWIEIFSILASAVVG